MLDETGVASKLTLTRQKIAQYRNGGEGFIRWAEDNVWMPIYPEGQSTSIWWPIGKLPDTPNPETGRSYKGLWESQRPHFIDALEMRDGRLRHRLIVFCWPRGEGKSAAACLIQMWKFFCFPKQAIVLGANSKDQTKFVHYDIIRDMILNSPALLEQIGGPTNIMERNIVMRDKKKQIVSSITPISSFSGIRSNITGYTFSEMFDMKSPKFFSQIDGSTRNVPNALGVIDSTVSDKGHILYKLYETSLNKSAPFLYFSYRFSQDGKQADYTHPQMGQTQLDDYKAKFLATEFDRYFKNLWEAGASRMFSPEIISAINYVGVDKAIGKHEEVVHLLRNVEQFRVQTTKLSVVEARDNVMAMNILQRGADLAQDAYDRLYPVSALYSYPNAAPNICIMDAAGLQALTEAYDTNFLLGLGLDRADPMSQSGIARTVLVAILKGLPGSRSNLYIEPGTAPPYMYFIAGMITYAQHDLEDIKKGIALFHDELDGVDTFCAERWGTWDLRPWCDAEGIETDLLSPTHEKQRAAFNELYILVNTGRLKSAPLSVLGNTNADLLAEELSVFTHDPIKRWFGSPEKGSKIGIQDDAVYSLGWGIWGMRELDATTFRPRRGTEFKAMYIPPETVYGRYA